MPTVTTQSGDICGVVQAAQGQADINAYLGVPYAQAPTGAGRWAPPRPLQPWTGTKEATKLPVSCPAPSTPVSATGFVGDEDCLFLNIWAPQGTSDSDQGAKDVLVYIPGGGFIVGGGSVPTYNGAFMAADSDVIVINMGYRLGSLGYLRYTDANAKIEGNFGLQDQILALKWIKENVGSFGGDPDKVTIFGESAGAMFVGLHTFSVPASNDLFRASIMDSNLAGAKFATPSQASTQGAAFVDILCQY